ncbi:MAG: ribonuclease III [Rhodospirillaceae bacterium]|jgi:ribonuclease III|nr:ribonuclease III [Rhodospirillaceae bacterium]MBT5245385.1 ribonuclease III [Rhodospirillaceae bacterium]MBT6242886.1 ribonuclease III [Rhodospirillaceae bacterium]
MAGPLSELELILDYTFSSPQLLSLALSHSSLAKSRADRDQTNQRLEFLGDRVLGLVIAGMIYETFPDEEEGAMARRHTALVRKEALARVALDLRLGSFILMAPSEEESGGRDNEALLADTCEAIIAALFMDGGLGTAESFIRRHWTPLMSEDLSPPKDAKTTLQEYVQSKGMNLPTYREALREGPPHDPIFTIEVSIDNDQFLSGKGRSKRQAEQGAASAMLHHLGIDVEETQ